MKMLYDLTKLQNAIDVFKTTDVWKTMQETVEDSPWHREQNVAVHTDMTIAAAAKTFPADRNEFLHRRHITLVTLALLFHDTGKPTAEVKKESEARGVYRSYAGHEQLSARSFENYVLNNWDQFDQFLTKWDVLVITWMIEHHLPYGLKDKEKVASFDKSLNVMFYPNGPEVFFNMLMGDTGGRISDAYETNYQNMMNWIDERARACADTYQETMAHFKDSMAHYEIGSPAMFMLIGPSGAGKSTYIKKHVDPETAEVFSLDALRLKFAEGKVPYVKGIGPIAEKAKYKLAYEHYLEYPADFTNYLQSELSRVFRSGKEVWIDNTNVGAKRRKQYLQMAKRNNLLTVAIYVPSSLDVVLARQASRDDKTVPPESVIQQYNSIAVPSFGGEFDVVTLADHNFVVKKT